MERNWVVSEAEPVGAVVARVNARDDQDDPLEFGLEEHAGFGNVVAQNRSLSFRIDNETGTVYTNESLVGRVSWNEAVRTGDIPPNDDKKEHKIVCERLEATLNPSTKIVLAGSLVRELGFVFHTRVLLRRKWLANCRFIGSLVQWSSQLTIMPRG